MQWMAEHGIAAYAVDFRGHGRSAGKSVAILKWDEYIDDLKAFLAIDELSNNTTPLFILGHSHGGLIAAAATIRGLLNHARGIILVAPYLDLIMPIGRLKWLAGYALSYLHPTLPMKSGIDGPMLTRDPQMAEDGKNDPYCRGIATPRWYLQTVKIQKQVRESAAKFSLPLLMLVPGDDTIADSQANVAFFNASSSADKTIRHYPEARHELLREINRMDAFTEILQWIHNH
jgi:alpha-beta hydrolase superfamily lysophospholipase